MRHVRQHKDQHISIYAQKEGIEKKNGFRSGIHFLISVQLMLVHQAILKYTGLEFCPTTSFDVLVQLFHTHVGPAFGVRFEKQFCTALHCTAPVCLSSPCLT